MNLKLVVNEKSKYTSEDATAYYALYNGEILLRKTSSAEFILNVLSEFKGYNVEIK
ncbi:hypothetical protein [Paenibacillus medicaginis]|uniref:Uncharacterized protein n=1 Tax=Paenibacillus medicaginis TaxID=1470560 RepID=A0ABV5BUU6_9BACL